MSPKLDAFESSRELQYRELPSVNEVLLEEPMQQLLQKHSHKAVVRAARAVIEEIRHEIADGLHSDSTLAERVSMLPDAIARELQHVTSYSLRKVINATGVVLHTNLGRAPLSRKALEHIVDVGGGYSNLEFDLDRGDRGKRDVHVESLLLALLRAEAGLTTSAETHGAIVVNNCAAATYLALHSLAKDKEVIVSRSELVEIGGGFRIPEILQESGALLKEVGTTNRTRVSDYERAISPNTGLILRVHQSNFSMDGFVERPRLEDLVALGKRMTVPVFEDQGTGLLQSLEPYGIQGEYTWTRSLNAGCNLVALSGDKLLGGPQCGILVGNRQLVEQIRRDPLFRTYRVDKLSYAALEATLLQYLDGSFDNIPILAMIATSKEEIAKRCRFIAGALSNARLFAEVREVESLVGGGTAPRARLASFAVCLRHTELSAEELLRALRGFDPPVIARIEEDQVLLDLRTVEPSYDAFLTEAIEALSLPSATSNEDRPS